MAYRPYPQTVVLLGLRYVKQYRIDKTCVSRLSLLAYLPV